MTVPTKPKRVIGRPFQPGNPGRPKGSRNALAESFLSALHADFQEHGVAAIKAMRQEKPAEYVKVVAGLLPAKIEVEKTGRGLSDADLERIIEEGLAGRGVAASGLKPNVDAVGRA